MPLFAERDSRFHGLFRKVVLFVLAAPIVVAAVIGAVYVKQDRFKQVTDVYFFAPSAYGLTRGMAVKLIGFKIGSVETISLEADARVKVKLAISTEYMRFITQDSTARLTKEGVIGQSIIEIEPGTDPRGPVAHNAVIPFEKTRDIGELAQELIDSVKPILADVKKITDLINDPKGDVRQTLGNVNKISVALAGAAESLRTLTASAGGKLDRLDGRLAATHGKLDQALDQVNTGISGVNRTVESVNARVPGILQKLESTLERVEATLGDVKRITATAAEEVPPMVRDTRALVEDSKAIVDGAKQSWPIRNLLPKAEERPVPLDSYETSPPQRP